MSSEDELNDIIEIRDPNIDAEAIMQKIRASIRMRKEQAEAQGVDYEAFVEGLYTSDVTARFDHNLYYDLRRMSVGYDKVGVGLSVSERNVPVIGGLIKRFREGLHTLVIYYVNMLAGQQARFNELVVRSTTSMVKTLEDGTPNAELDALREEITNLKQRVAELEARESA